MSGRLRTLRRGTGGRIVLGVDFTERRSVTSFPEMAAAFPDESVSFLECDVSLVDEVPPDRAHPDEYVRLVLDELGDSGYEVMAVLGRCGGAGLACQVAEGLHAAELATPVVAVFDAEVVDEDVAFVQFDTIVRGLDTSLEESVVTGAIRSFHDVLASRRKGLPQDGGDLEPVLRLMRETYRPLVLRAMREEGTPAQFGEYMAERFSVFTRYLMCASRAPVEVTYGPVHRILCRDHDTRGTEHGRPATRLAVDHGDLMDSPQVSDLVLDLLGTPW